MDRGDEGVHLRQEVLTTTPGALIGAPLIEEREHAHRRETLCSDGELRRFPCRFDPAAQGLASLIGDGLSSTALTHSDHLGPR